MFFSCILLNCLLVKVFQPSATSALMMWNIVTTKENSSYITDYDIYLHPNFLKRIARKYHGTQFNIIGLKPCSDYKVGIVALDGSSQRSDIRYSEVFKTIEAGKHNCLLTHYFCLSLVNLRAVKLLVASCELRAATCELSLTLTLTLTLTRSSQLAARNSQVAARNFTARKLPVPFLFE